MTMFDTRYLTEGVRTWFWSRCPVTKVLVTKACIAHQTNFGMHVKQGTLQCYACGQDTWCCILLCNAKCCTMTSLWTHSLMEGMFSCTWPSVDFEHLCATIGLGANTSIWNASQTLLLMYSYTSHQSYIHEWRLIKEVQSLLESTTNHNSCWEKMCQKDMHPASSLVLVLWHNLNG